MLSVHGLTRRFGDLVAVDDVSFEVPAGGLTGFVGGNGAGKTTTMRMIMGVLAAHAGEVLWNGRAVTAADRRRFGYMPEERGLYPKQPILEQLVYLAQLRGLDAVTARREIGDLLERFGLGERTREPLEKLSLGNQQRVQIVAALVPRPDVLILDEPFSGLDPTAIDAMADLLREQAASGVPVVFSSHQLDLVDRLCDRLVVMARGTVVMEGTAEDLRTRGPLRYRLVAPGARDWVTDVPGISVVESTSDSTVVEVHADGAEQEVLRRATTLGPVAGFSREVPRLSQIYRELTA